MKRAHVLNERDIKRVFAAIARSAFPARNRAMFQLSDPPPLNWSTLKYVLFQRGGSYPCLENVISLKR
jgi:uncharacterized protein YneF (UPF0154 family)